MKNIYVIAEVDTRDPWVIHMKEIQGELELDNYFINKYKLISKYYDVLKEVSDNSKDLVNELEDSFFDRFTDDNFPYVCEICHVSTYKKELEDSIIDRSKQILKYIKEYELHTIQKI